ncbi:MAG: type I methionyl aminopeptidase [Candidatus Omnitrophica bacterium]|nr:type I methionyl aminopeptidase [Candidatus Omnitrophota bacterium]
MICIKSAQDLASMRTAGLILAEILEKVRNAIKEGVATIELDNLSRRLMKDAGVESAFLGYRGYPANICVSVNDEIVHGIPGPRILKSGDIVSLDMGVKHQGFYSDAAVTVGIGKLDLKAKQLIEITKEALMRGIKQMKPDARLSDISAAIQEYSESFGFGVVRQFVGHGIGRELHEEPEIPNFGQRGRGPLLKVGMVLAIEPMINAGTWECKVLDDGWTAVTKDGLCSAHWEHTVALTDKGPEILTKYYA